VVQQSGFDGIWSSSLADSAVMALPDSEFYGLHKRLDQLRYTMSVTHKPILMDVDSGGHTEHLRLHMCDIQNLGVSGIVIEDKIGYKRNSLYGAHSGQKQAHDTDFAHKLATVRSTVMDPEFMIVARIESLILGETVDQALDRANLYVQSGANAVMIHSIETDAMMLLQFLRRFRRRDTQTPLVVVPTTFNRITATQLHSEGVNVVIYANHLIRASMSAMIHTANQILHDDMSQAIDETIMPVKDLLDFVPHNDPSR
jgi:phosphoenolpyruvate phosphomutase